MHASRPRTRCGCMPERATWGCSYLQPSSLSDDGESEGKKGGSRPVSADNAKYIQSKVKSASKLASSDSKINRRIVTKSKGKIDRESVKQLKHELNAIKEQLLCICENRNEALNLTNELEMRYKYLHEQNINHKSEISCLKQENKKLQNQLHELDCQCNQQDNITECFEEATECPIFAVLEKQLRQTLNDLKSRNAQNKQCEQCNIHKEEIASLKNQYEKMVLNYQQIAGKLRAYESTNKNMLDKMKLLKNTEKDLIGQLVKFQDFSAELSRLNNDDSIVIADLKRENFHKDSIIKCLQAEIASKHRKLELVSKNEEGLKQKNLQLQEELVGSKMMNSSLNNSVQQDEQWCCHLSDELQDLISALYQEIDKAIAKDELIEYQNQEIQGLQCALACKERDMMAFENELNKMRAQCNNITGKRKRMGECPPTLEQTD